MPGMPRWYSGTSSKTTSDKYFSFKRPDRLETAAQRSFIHFLCSDLNLMKEKEGFCSKYLVCTFPIQPTLFFPTRSLFWFSHPLWLFSPDGVAEHVRQQANWEAEYERHAAKVQLLPFAELNGGKTFNCKTGFFTQRIFRKYLYLHFLQTTFLGIFSVAD